jgi:hypothetical protein
MDNSESNPRKRPNAAYRLSKETVEGDQLTFYYDRQQRLAKAPKVVKELCKEEPPPRFSLLKPLTGSKPRAMMFASIVLICAGMLVISVFEYTRGAHELAGNRVSIQANRYEGATGVTLKKSSSKGGLFSSKESPYIGAVDIAVSPVKHAGTEMPPVLFHRVIFSHNTAEEYRFSVPYDSDELVLVLQTGQKSLNVKIKPR